MNKAVVIFIICFFAKVPGLFAQDDAPLLIIKDTVATVRTEIDPLRPARAAFYSAILPGLGQAYNKQYWKIPLVYGGIGAGVYFYIDNNNKYREFRNIYKRRLAGYRDDKYQFLDDNGVIRAQRFYQKNRDLSLAIAIGFYILNVVDANISSHLIQFNVDDNLSLRPSIYQSTTDNTYNMGFKLCYTF